MAAGTGRAGAQLPTPVDNVVDNDYVVSMLPTFTARGVLPPGEHAASWNDVTQCFGGNSCRDRLLNGLRKAASNLRDAGVRSLWLDGSFVTGKPEPNDWDGVWDTMGADLAKVDPVLIDRYDMATGRYRQKAKYGGELLIGIEGSSGKPFHEFFQQDTNGDVKGIVLLDLGTLP
jgi:hypothetical protein